ncbi:MAG: 3',5'-cyclic-nucleotide phosphodiesterase [Candidatus Rokuibacteriota bacterium]|nr:MAG: 3',5'-cyclic-nucleotide phosphodiesterase [Candidatus Rokubacteria bacterium]
MKIRVLGAFGGEGLAHRPSAFLVNDRVLIDGGSVPAALTVGEQLQIDHALVSHCHLDHVAGLAFLAETIACCAEGQRVTIASLPPIVDAMKHAVFNNIVWPDFAVIPPGAPAVGYRALGEGVEHVVSDLLVTPVAVTHTVPTSGFIVHDGEAGLVYSGDTGPTEALWKAIRPHHNIRGILLECTFPNRLGDLATASGHMTPALIAQELPKLPPDTPVWIYHIKPPFFEETAMELERIGGGRVSLLEQDKVYQL